VPTIVVSGLTDAETRAALANNKIAANAGWDRSILAAELGELAALLPEINLDVSITGFDAAEIDSLTIDFTDAEREPDACFSDDPRYNSNELGSISAQVQ
jgi:hypothetical protein